MRDIRLIATLIAACVVASPSTTVAQQRAVLYRSPKTKQYTFQNSIKKYSVSQRNQTRIAQTLPSGLRNSSRSLLGSALSSNSSPRGPKNKPFSNVQRGSNLSPYLNIGGIPTGDLPNYYSLVRPQLEQQRNQRQQQQSQAFQQREITRLQKIQAQAARAPFNVQGDPNVAPTGHAAVFQNLSGRFQNYGGYYQQPR